MSYTKLYIHLIVRTKSSQPTLSLDHSDDLYRYVWGVVRNKQSVLYRINGMEDHLHIFFSMTPTIALSDFVRDLKVETSKMLKRTVGYESFDGWSEGYAAVTCGEQDKERVINYIKAQREHHKHHSFRDEYVEFLHQMGLELDERDWLR
ncbi:MAG: IS200/IS605 family transposase [Breznakibacter sp.]